MLSAWSFNLFLLRSLPLAWIAGLKVQKLSRAGCTCSVPMKHWTKNPFRSIYFAAQAMAAELSTGALVLYATQGNGPSMSTLVTGMRATYHKKATERIYFTCSDGEAIAKAIQEAQQSGNAVQLVCRSEGRTKEGVLVAHMEFQWSVKART